MATETRSLPELLREHGQEHLLTHLDGLDGATRERLCARLRTIDWDELARPEVAPEVGEVGASRVVTLAERQQREERLSAAGEAALREGRVAVLMVAGGQGTRLGFAGPKGCYPLAPHSGKTLYQLQAEKVLALSRRVGQAVPFLVMTSPVTDVRTRAAFAEHDRFGLAAGQLRVFRQGTLPSVDRAGRALLGAPGTLLESPDGHGGCFTALVESGELHRLERAGIRHVVYIQVDNVLAPLDDPAFVGLGVEERADVVTKVLEKTHPDEKVGHLVRVAGRDRIVEYTELTAEDTRMRAPDGSLVYRWGSPALHLWSVAFLARLASKGFRPPLHRSAKPLRAWLDGALREIDGWKYERFIFDLLPQARVCIGLEIDRASEFSPIKNAEGENSPATAVEGMSRQYASWLEAAGVEVELSPGARIEIDPLLAATRRELVERWDGRVERVTGDLHLQEDRRVSGAPDRERGEP
ncbi:MAG: UTP--glucose-1-phosphate uridylyltransferase [Actinobacteria bacterium]|nr:UTP--glucose-1-phosphate uridylyltransferase [Actinomycetota bacterium]